MTLLYATCVWFLWTPATGATHYDVYVNNIFEETVIDLEIEMCGFGLYASHDIYVVGLNDAEETGPDSGYLVFAWVADFDRDDNGSVGFSDFGLFVRVYGSSSPADLWADANENGVVDFADFGKFVARFAKCNNGIREVTCG